MPKLHAIALPCTADEIDKPTSVWHTRQRKKQVPIYKSQFLSNVIYVSVNLLQSPFIGVAIGIGIGF